MRPWERVCECLWRGGGECGVEWCVHRWLIVGCGGVVTKNKMGGVTKLKGSTRWREKIDWGTGHHR